MAVYIRCANPQYTHTQRMRFYKSKLPGFPADPKRTKPLSFPKGDFFRALTNLLRIILY